MYMPNVRKFYGQRQFNNKPKMNVYNNEDKENIPDNNNHIQGNPVNYFDSKNNYQLNQFQSKFPVQNGGINQLPNQKQVNKEKPIRRMEPNYLYKGRNKQKSQKKQQIQFQVLPKEGAKNNSSENISNASTKASTPSNYFEERMNPQYLYEYSDELYQSMKEAESVNAVTYDENFWTKTGLDQRKRNSFIHYMYLIHLRFSLLPETLFLAVNLFDRVILKVKLDTDHLQMAAVTSLFIASKYQEIYPPDARDFIGIIGKMYTVEQMLDMEVKILKILDYEVLTTSTLVFFEYLLDVKMLNKDENIYCLGSMFLECNLFNMDILHYSPRLQAAGCIYLAYQLTQSTTESTLRELSFFSGKAENDIRKFVSLFLFGFNHSIEPISKGAIVKKYCREEYNKVSFFLRNTNNK